MTGTMTGTVLVATAGQGILRTNDDGRTWHRLGLREPIEFDGVVRALAVDPTDPARIYAGADCGLCASDDGGASWRRIASPVDGMTVWSVAVAPSDPAVIYAGTGAPSRAVLVRSTDRGAHWSRVGPEIPEFCAGVNRPRLLTICIDPADPTDVWFGVEEGGAWRSRDGGHTWARLDGPAGGIDHSDIHCITVLPGGAGRPKRQLVLTVNSVFVSEDDGRSWHGEPSFDRFDRMYYTRCAVPLADDPATVLLAVGDGTPGTRSALYRSTDGGTGWSPAYLEQPPNSTFWVIGTHPADPRLVFAGTKYGHLYRSRDRGESWTREWREFPEITAVAWTPFVAPLAAHAQSIKSATTPAGAAAPH
jgi:photosystem II stability/assembly factor-like uncharacterized protein